MATKVNEILQFASQDTGSNLLTQGEYDSDAQRVIGHQPGIARSRLENKVLRQCSTIAAGVAQFMFQNQNGSITDGMTPQEVADAMQTSVAAASPNMTMSKYSITATDTTGKMNVNLLPYNNFALELSNGSLRVIITVLDVNFTAKTAETGNVKVSWNLTVTPTPTLIYRMQDGAQTNGFTSLSSGFIAMEEQYDLGNRWSTTSNNDGIMNSLSSYFNNGLQLNRSINLQAVLFTCGTPLP